MPQRTILVPLDGSRTALRAAPYAAALAALGEPSRVVLFMALPTREQPDSPLDGRTRDRWERAANLRLRSSARRLRSLGVKDVEVEVRWGVQDDDEILAAAQRHGASLIVMGTHGRGGLSRALLGSVAMGVLQHSPVPCVFVPPGPRVAEARLQRALLAVDGTELSEQTIPLAKDLAKAGVKISVLRVVPPAATLVPFAMPGVEGYMPISVMDDMTAAAEANVKDIVAQFPAGAAQGEVLIGAPARAITDYAERNTIDLIIMTTHGRGVVGRMLLGSVTDRVMRTAKAPVLVVRPS